MSFRVRSSKFRHVYGQTLRKEQSYDNVRVSKSSWDSPFCVVNPKFLAIIVECGGGGGFIVIDLKQVGRQPPDAPIVGGHKGAVLDIAWNPFDDNVIASASEDCLVKVWHIPDGGITQTLQDPTIDLLHHQRRVGIIRWHPSAEGVLVSAGGDNLLVVWNVALGEPLTVLDCIPEQIWSVCWSWNGSKLLTTSKDKRIRILDPRTGAILEEAFAHEGSKCSFAIFLRNDLVFTTGFSKRSERQYSLRAPGSLDSPILQNEIDSSNGVMFPFYDPDTNLIFLCGKGDSVVRYFEVTSDPYFVHYINTFQTSDSQRAIGMMPKRGCDFKTCEITRFYRVNNGGLCSVHPFVVPRKSELFQEDLYPDTVSNVAALTAEEWSNGRDADPLLVSVRKQEDVVGGAKRAPNNINKAPVRQQNKTPAAAVSAIPAVTLAPPSNNSAVHESNGVGHHHQPQQQPSVPQMSADEVVSLVETVVKRVLADYIKQLDKNALEMSKMKAVIVRHDERLHHLENRLKQMSGAQQTNSCDTPAAPPADQHVTSGEGDHQCGE